MWEKIGDILSTLHDGVTIADAGGIFVYASKSCKDTFGVEPDQILGRSARLLEQNGIFSPCITAQVLQKKEKVRSVQKNRDGQEQFVTGIPQFDKDGKLEAVICYSSWEVTGYDDLKSSYDKLKQDNLLLKREILELKQSDQKSREVVERSKATRDNIRLLKKFVSTGSPVMLSGPDGSGKSFLARMIFPVEKEYNCELVSEEVMERELFGEPGGLEGILDAAGTGTALLLHAECLPVHLMRRLTVYVKEHAIKLVVTANRSLEQLKKEERIPNDFYYLFRVCEINVPPINERFEDLSGFLDYYLDIYNHKYDRKVCFTPSAMECLLSYGWPENINEIKYTLERIVLTAEHDKVDVFQLPEKISEESMEHFTKTSLKDALEFYEKGIIERAYEKYKTTVRISQELGISQATAVRKIQKYITKAS